MDYDALRQKYGRLTQEYGKLSSKYKILKESFIKEKSQSSELQTNLREREQQLRRLTQENESVLFMQTQLTKRVDILQQELDHSLTKQKKLRLNWTSKNSSKVSNHSLVLEEELTKRIEENENLHSKLERREFEHGKIIEELSEKILRLQNDTQLSTFSEVDQLDYKSELEKLQIENTNLTAQLRSSEKLVEQMRSQSNSRTSDFLTVSDQCDLQSLDAMSIASSSSSLPIDVSYLKLEDNKNLFRLFSIDNNRRQNVVSFTRVMGNQLITALSNWHLYMGERSSMLSHLPEAESVTCKQVALRKLLDEVTSHFQDFNVVHSTCFELSTPLFQQGSFQKFLKLFTKYLIEFWSTVVMLQKQCEHEAVNETTNDNVHVDSIKLAGNFSTLACCILSLESIIGNLSLDVGNARPAFDVLFTELKQCAQDLDTVFNYLFKSFNEQILNNSASVESEKQRSNCEVISSCLLSISHFINKLLDFLNEHRSGFARQYQLMLDYVQCQNKMMLFTSDSTDSEVTTPVNTTFQRQLSSLSDMEEQLIKLREEKMYFISKSEMLQTRVKELENLQKISDSPSKELSEEEKSNADSLAIFYADECKCLYKQLSVADDEMKQCLGQINKLQSQLIQVQDDLSTTSNSYSEQLANLTEQTCSLQIENDTLKEEMELLKNSRSRKSLFQR